MAVQPLPHNVFDRHLYADVFKDWEEARHLPRWCYQSEAFYQRELERIFLCTWTFIDRVDAIPNVGDYLCVDTFAGPIIVLRNLDGVVRAFANTCRHRGSRLLSGTGNRRSIVCPYHSWTYDLDGKFCRALSMERTGDFKDNEPALKPIRLETWGGFIFINFDDDSEDLHDYLGDLTTRFESYNFEEMVCTRRTEFSVACNWKLLIENAHEDYHTATVHKNSLGLQESQLVTSAPGNWEALYLPMRHSSRCYRRKSPLFLTSQISQRSSPAAPFLLVSCPPLNLPVCKIACGGFVSCHKAPLTVMRSSVSVFQSRPRHGPSLSAR